MPLQSCTMPNYYYDYYFFQNKIVVTAGAVLFVLSKHHAIAVIYSAEFSSSIYANYFT